MCRDRQIDGLTVFSNFLIVFGLSYFLNKKPIFIIKHFSTVIFESLQGDI